MFGRISIDKTKTMANTDLMQQQEQPQQQQQQMPKQKQKEILTDIAQTPTASQQQQQQQQQQSVVNVFEVPSAAIAASTIIDIPSPCKSQISTGFVSISPTSALSSSSSSSSSTSYDTDTSTVSSTCCTRHGEHIYMQRAIIVSKQQAKDIEADATDVDYKDEHKKSWPIFILLISVIEIGIFVYDLATVQMQQQQQQQQDLPMPIPNDSVFIYRPDRRLQIWRFVSYMFLHANWFHLGFNVVVQLFYGVPLEVMHGSVRVAIIYFAGVFAGSLGTSVVDSEVYLVGASGGVYGILAAHLANITLNYGQMKYAVAQLVSVVIFVSCDLGYAFYTQYLAVIELTKAPPVSYIAHLTGALAGLTIGLLVLKNFEHRAYENVIWWLALGVYCAFTVFAIVFNLINTVTAQLMEEQSEVITQHLLHDLGVS